MDCYADELMTAGHDHYLSDFGPGYRCFPQYQVQ